MDTVAEQSALDACRSGTAGAYRPLVDAYYGRAVGLARLIVGDAEEAKDLAQEAFVAAFRALPKHESGRPFYPWLRGILINRCRTYMRGRRRAWARRAATAEHPGHWARAGAVASGAKRMRDRDLVRRAMAPLGEDDRTLLVLKHVEGYTYDEIAASLGIPSGTVMSRLYRARQRLRASLAELDPSLLEENGNEAGDLVDQEVCDGK